MNPHSNDSNTVVLKPSGNGSLIQQIRHHIVSTLGNDYHPPKKQLYYNGLAFSVRDRLIQQWLQTQRAYYDTRAKRVYYLSLEFLPGRFLRNNLIHLGMEQECARALEATGFSLEDLEEEEWDAGLGNGGLGRLASCFLDSMASLQLPGYGYGIRYDYGIFFQTIVDGYQVERADNWVRSGTPWEVQRRGYLYPVKFYGRSEPYRTADDRIRYRWADTETVMAMACDIFVPGFRNEYGTNMRLWAAMASREFDLEYFHQGDYMGAMEAKVFSENISKVLYPSENVRSGRELRLKQEYFVVSATFQDILRRFKKHHDDFVKFSNHVAIHLNETHPAIAVPELMRLLVDEEDVDWERAWKICVRTFAYTNHTVMPEALETWPVELLERILPRHMDIIQEINRRFIQKIKKQYPGEPELIERLSILEHHHEPCIRMAHLAIVGSHAVNGVSALHTRILKQCLFKEFDRVFPGRIQNITNGISHRRWLLQINPDLTDLICSAIGTGWIQDLNRLVDLAPHADDPQFRDAWQKVKRKNKINLARYIHKHTGHTVNPDTLFDVQIKRIHEYKRQVLNVLHVLTLYRRIKQSSLSDVIPRTVIFAGKAAPGYALAKLIIKLIHSTAELVNNDPEVHRYLNVIFLPNYSVSQAEKVIPAADLSEQISTAGMEASGTGNMKFALNGSQIIGTLDGANIEIMEEIGRENIFIFGLTAEQVKKMLSDGYDPFRFYESDPELRHAVDLIGNGTLSPENPKLFEPITEALLAKGDRFLLMPDYRPYIQTQADVARIFRDSALWTRRCILGTAGMGFFSSDRAITEYAEKIWNVTPLNTV